MPSLKEQTNAFTYAGEGICPPAEVYIPEFATYSRRNYEYAILRMAGHSRYAQTVSDKWMNRKAMTSNASRYWEEGEERTLLPKNISPSNQTRLIERTRNADRFNDAIHHLVRCDIDKISPKMWIKLVDLAINGNRESLYLLYMAAHMNEYAVDSSNPLSEYETKFKATPTYKANILCALHHALKRFGMKGEQIALMTLLYNNEQRSKNAQTVVSLFLNSDFLHKTINFEDIHPTSAAMGRFVELSETSLPNDEQDIQLAFVNLGRSKKLYRSIDNRQVMAMVRAGYLALPEEAQITMDAAPAQLQSRNSQNQIREKARYEIKKHGRRVEQTMAEVFGSLVGSSMMAINTLAGLIEANPDRSLCHRRQITRNRQSLSVIARLVRGGARLSEEQVARLTTLNLRNAPLNDQFNVEGRQFNFKLLAAMLRHEPRAEEEILKVLTDQPLSGDNNLPFEFRQYALQVVLGKAQNRNREGFHQGKFSIEQEKINIWKWNLALAKGFPDNAKPHMIAEILAGAAELSIDADRREIRSEVLHTILPKDGFIQNARKLVNRINAKLEDISNTGRPAHSPYAKAGLFAQDRLERRLAWAERMYAKRSLALNLQSNAATL